MRSGRMKVKVTAKVKAVTLTMIDKEYMFGYIVGLVLGDGYVRIDYRKGKYRVCFTNTQVNVLNRFQDFAKLLGFHPSRLYLRKNNKGDLYFEVYFCSKKMTLIINDLKQNPELFKEYLINDSGKLGFLAGLYDSEGSMKHKERRDRPTPQHLAYITMTNIHVLKVAYSFAREFNLRVGIYRYNKGRRNYKDEYCLQFNGNKSTFEFLQLTNPVHPLKTKCPKCNYPEWYK